MSDLYDRIVSERGGFEKLLERIPGFRGYIDLAARRTADRMIRDYVADMVAQRLRTLATLQKQILDQDGGLALMSDVESARTKWQTFHDRVKAAAPGYSGFFEQNKIDAEDLERLYSFDEAQARYADQFGEKLTTLETAIDDKGDVAAAIADLDALAVEANEAFGLREDVLTGLGK